MPLFCSHCGSENANDASQCTRCDAQIGHYGKSSDTAPTRKLFAADSVGVWVITAVVCGLYLINPTFGIFEFLPDNLAIIGNLDEAAATTGLLLALSKLGLNPFDKQ